MTDGLRRMTDGLPYELDYAELAVARETLSSAAEVLWRESSRPGACDAMRLTRCAVMCEVADDAIFNALNTLAHHADDPAALRMVGAAAPELSVRFGADDECGLWSAGDLAFDKGHESVHPDAPHVHVLRLMNGEIITLSDPYGRGLIEQVER